MSMAATMGPLSPTRLSLALEYFRRTRWLQALTITCVSGVSFAILMKSALVLLFGNGIAVSWPVVGLVSAAMLQTRRQNWLWVVLGIAAGHVYVEHVFSLGEMLVDTVCDISEILITVYTLPPFTHLSKWMGERHLVARFITFPVLLGPLMTSIPVGVVYSRELHDGFWKEAAHWFFADALGIVLWLPLALVLVSAETYALFRWKTLVRTVSLVGLVIIVGLLIFARQPLPVAFVMMPILLLVGLQSGFSASVLSVNVLAMIGALATLHGMGAFAMVDGAYRVMMLQVYLAMCMLSCFPISIIMMERDTLEHGLRKAYDSMERLATKDGLTGLANRRQFDLALVAEWSRALRENRQVGLLMIDVDCFKLYNDSYGHVAGDDCLRRIAAALSTTVLRAGDLVGRYGGEEFFVLMPGTDLAGAMIVGEKVRQAVEAMGLKHHRNPSQVVTISVGCHCVVPRVQVSPQSLVEAADEALYAAKQGGRNRVMSSEPHSLKKTDTLVAATG